MSSLLAFIVKANAHATSQSTIKKVSPNSLWNVFVIAPVGLYKKGMTATACA